MNNGSTRRSTARKPMNPWRTGGIPPQVLTWLIVAVVVGLPSIWAYRVMHPQAVQALNVRPTDAYAIMADLKPLTLLRGTALGEVFGDLTLGGNHWLVVVRDSPQGKFLIVETKLARRFLTNNQKGQGDKLSLSPSNVRLLGPDGQAAAPLFLTGRYNQPQAKLSLQRLGKQEPFPFDHPRLDPWRHEGQTSGKLEPRFRIDDVLELIAGARRFEGARGMLVEIKGSDGPAVTLAWDGQSTAWRAATEIDEVVDPLGAWGEWAVTMLFPKPSSGGSVMLEVHGQRVKQFYVQ